MSLVSDFYSKLAAAMPANSVHAIKDTSGKFPSVVYSVREQGRELFYKDSYGMKVYNFQVDIYSLSYSELNGLKEAIKAAFHGFSGEMGASLVHRSSVDLMIDTYEDDDEFVYQVIIDISIST